MQVALIFSGQTLQSVRPFLRLMAAAAATIAIAGCAAVATGPVSDSAPTGTTWKWNYRSFDTLSNDETPSGVLRLTRSSGGYEARLELHQPHECYKGSMRPAKVDIGKEKTTIFVSALMPGCGDRLYTVANDGSGGTLAIRTGRTVQRNGVVVPDTEWVNDINPRGLTAFR